jgi:hypothetical protein
MTGKLSPQKKFASSSMKMARVCWRETAAVMRENGAGPACGGARQIDPPSRSVIAADFCPGEVVTRGKFWMLSDEKDPW